MSGADCDPELPLDWLGQPIKRRECGDAALNREGLCREGAAGVRDRSARRVDSFFKEHRDLANGYLDDCYFELRTVAAKYASVLRLRALLDDPEPEVREAAPARLA
ncbi:MAG TPA: 4Fe4S-binding leucine-rich repeat protein [Methylocystis sp.]|nr:4Fe4S-binding leucine-rich repeat protein [Methylocystis sp.]